MRLLSAVLNGAFKQAKERVISNGLVNLVTENAVHNEGRRNGQGSDRVVGFPTISPSFLETPKGSKWKELSKVLYEM